MRKLKIRHLTTYSYAQAVQASLHSAHLSPRPDPLQSAVEAKWIIDPEPVELREHNDYFGNPTLIFRIDRPHEELKIDIELWVNREAAFAFLPSISWQQAKELFFQSAHLLPAECWPYLPHSFYTPFIEDLKSYTQACFNDKHSLFDACCEFMTRIYKDFSFDSSFSRVDTPLVEIFKHRRGVCQDFSHIMLSGLRSLGIPARYVSGYIETLPVAGKEKLVGADASHAWVSVYFPEFGWLDFDPTNNKIPSDQHISIACGRDYLDVSPIRGIFHGLSDHQLSVSVDVREV